MTGTLNVDWVAAEIFNYETGGRTCTKLCCQTATNKEIPKHVGRS